MSVAPLSRQLEVSIERVIDAPVALVWAFAADTNRWDRLAGFGRTRYRYEPIPGTREQSRIGTARMSGMDVSWVEWGEWIEGQFLHGERRFIDGPLEVGGYRVEVSAAGLGTRLVAKTWVLARSPLPESLAQVMEKNLSAGLAAYASSVARILASAAPGFKAGDAPPTTRARAILFDAPPDETAGGRTTPTNENDLEFLSSRFADSRVDPAIRRRLIEHLRTRPDEELRAMRPYELARAWGISRRAALRAFLHAARAGLIDLRWQINCPVCRVGADTRTSLAAVERKTHCDDCNVSYDVDFASNVEAVFQISAALRKVTPAVYCGASPWWRPHVFAAITLAPGEKRTVEVDLPKSQVSVRTLRGGRRATVPWDGAPPGRLDINIGVMAINLRAEGGPWPSLINLTNETHDEVVLLVERNARDADAVLGTDVATMTDFLDLFDTEAPATGVDLTIGSLTVLFSDLTGTTALYERAGDARAFAMIQEHFRAMTSIIDAHEGAVVKTMGDAIMATFPSPEQGVAAALEMARQTRLSHGPEGLTLKIGVHAGPCLVVRANGRMDFFGSTVNLASRLQTQACGGQIVFVASLYNHPGVARLVEAARLTAHRTQARLKGVQDAQAIVVLDA